MIKWTCHRLCFWSLIPLMSLQIRADAINTVFHHLSEFQPYYDENGKLSKHLLLYPVACASLFHDQYLTQDGTEILLHGRIVHPLADEAEHAFFGSAIKITTFEDCNAVCVERGVDHSLIQYPMAHLYFRSKGKEKSQEFWEWYIHNCANIQFGFMNYYSKDHHLNVYFIDKDNNNEKSLRAQVEYGEKQTKFIGTFIGHTFVVEDSITNEVLLEQVVEFAGFRAIGNLKVANEDKVNFQKSHVEQLEVQRLEFEWNRAQNVKYTFTPLGFAKGRLPNDIFAQMGAYYYNNRNAKFIEEYELFDVYINWWEADDYMIPIAWNMKPIWQERLLELMQQWVGPDVALEQTDMYGMRAYTNGARLLSHVDREETHAVSFIINIEQINVTKPWTVEIYDHANRLHEIEMKPGEIVYYESAKCLHGRNTPLQGNYYVNLFTHYRPLGDPQWYTKPGHHDQPLIDVGRCDLVGPADAYSQGSVQCEDRRIGPHLSPKLSTINSSQDLFDHRRAVKEMGIEAPPSSFEKNTDDNIVIDSEL